MFVSFDLRRVQAVAVLPLLWYLLSASESQGSSFRDRDSKSLSVLPAFKEVCFGDWLSVTLQYTVCESSWSVILCAVGSE